ncbi:MAG: HepT-like ribonuclease domain-containing protein [Methanoregula sp.]
MQFPISKIFQKISLLQKDLKGHPLERAGIERMLSIIGEAAKNVSQQLRKDTPDIPWKATAGMRDKLIHHYFGVDYEAVYETVMQDLPALKREIQKILKNNATKKPGTGKTGKKEKTGL